MPQLDVFALFPQFFWFSLTFIVVYFDIYLLLIMLMIMKDTRDGFDNDFSEPFEIWPIEYATNAAFAAYEAKEAALVEKLISELDKAMEQWEKDSLAILAEGTPSTRYLMRCAGGTTNWMRIRRSRAERGRRSSASSTPVARSKPTSS